MGYFYAEGEQKIRAGVYKRYSNRTPAGEEPLLDGVNAIVIQSAWGPVDAVTTHTSQKSIRETYGDGEGTDAALAVMGGGASCVYICRTGKGKGTAGTAVIDEKLTITAKYPGEKALKVKVQAMPGEEDKKQLLIVDGTAVKETYTVDAGDTEASLFADALADSSYVTAAAVVNGSLAASEVSLTGGKNPEVTLADYVEGFYALEPYHYNVICTDSEDVDVADALTEYVEESVEAGKQVIAVTGQGSGTEFKKRLARAKEMNSAYIVYLGNGYVDADGNRVEGVKAVAYTAGMVSATPSSQSVVHAIVPGAADTIEKFTNAQYEEAIRNGMLLISRSQDGQVWFDSGINTLTELSEKQDAGWKKIKRTKVRIELMARIDRVLERKIGRVNCDPDGIADILQTGTGVLNAMVEERKLLAGARMYEDPENPYGADSAWFLIEADDIDTLEKIYLHYQFRYSQNV